MARIGLQSWGTRGDIVPFLGLANTLARRGHEVELSIATDIDTSYESHDGVTITRVPGEVTRAQTAALSRDIAQIGAPLEQARAMMARAFSPYVEALTEAAHRLAAQSDLVVRHHFLYMAQTAALVHDIPEVSVFLTPDLIPTRAYSPTGMPSFGPLQPLAWWMMAKGAGSVFMPGAIEDRRAHDLAAPSHLMRDVWCSRDANIVGVSPALCPPPSDWPGHVHTTGFLVDERDGVHPSSPDARLEDFLTQGAPPLYATFGSMMPADSVHQKQTIDLLRDAARALGERLVVECTLDQEDSPECLFIDGSPHASVFPRCKAIIHHGGAGTTQTTIRAGKAAIIVPHLADQFFWGEHISRSGLGAHTPARHKLGVKTLIRAIDKVRDNQPMSERIQSMSRHVQTERSLEEAAKVVESSLRA